MSNFSDYTETNVLAATLRGVAFPIPAGTHLALCTADPTESAMSNEATGGWYARQSVGLTTGWTAPSASAGGMMSQNSNLIAYSPVTGGSVTITHIAIMDAASGGNMLYWSALASPKTLQIGDVLQFAANSIQVTVK